MTWAEQVLRHELIERGVTGEELDELVAFRPAIERATAERIGHEQFSAFGPIGAIGLGGALAATANAFFGWRAAVLAGIAVALVFSCFLQGFVRCRFAQADGGISLAAIKGVIVLAAIAFGVIYGIVVIVR